VTKHTFKAAPALLAWLAAAALAHPIDPVPAADPKLAAEIATMRQSLRTAAANRDVGLLRRFYTEDFTHTHTSGKVDGKWFDVRWTQTFVRTSQGWQMAVSQATGLPNTVRDAP
jgi:hypothetical protein